MESVSKLTDPASPCEKLDYVGDGLSEETGRLPLKSGRFIKGYTYDSYVYPLGLLQDMHWKALRRLASLLLSRKLGRVAG